MAVVTVYRLKTRPVSVAVQTSEFRLSIGNQESVRLHHSAVNET